MTTTLARRAIAATIALGALGVSACSPAASGPITSTFGSLAPGEHLEYDFCTPAPKTLRLVSGTTATQSIQPQVVETGTSVAVPLSVVSTAASSRTHESSTDVSGCFTLILDASAGTAVLPYTLYLA